MALPDHDLLLVDEALWVITASTGLGIYDFSFEAHFPCRHPWERREEVTAVARMGAIDDYPATYAALAAEGIRLIHSPEQYVACTELTNWYPRLEGFTPRSVYYEELPTAEQVERDLGWPVFVKGARQTSRHRRQLSCITGPEEFERAMQYYRKDSILRWQDVVCREHVRLRLVEDPLPERIPSSFEFRTFWWKGQLVGAGRYWWEGKIYEWTAGERREALAIAEMAAGKIEVPFLVVDVAQASDGRWLVIECNDGQESGYAGASPIGIWQNVISQEKGDD